MVDTFCVEALREGDWNWMFERDAAVKIIKEKLDLDLSHVGYESIQF